MATRASVIDVGCGALGILHLLCARVGPGGRVVGVDREPRILEAARHIAAQWGLSVEFVPCDANHLALRSDAFDFVHEPTVLQGWSTLTVADDPGAPFFNDTDRYVVSSTFLGRRPGGTRRSSDPTTPTRSAP